LWRPASTIDSTDWIVLSLALAEVHLAKEQLVDARIQ
jgi:hypothetical protein